MRNTLRRTPNLNLWFQPENSRFEARDRSSSESSHAQWLSCCKNTSGWRPNTKTVWCLSSLLITAIRPGFETVSWQHAAHAQQRSYLIGAESLSSTTKLSKPKKGSTGRVGERQFGTKDFSLQK